MASSSRASASTSSLPLLKQSRVNDAVKVAPYLTHVVRHHGQVTLIPPENLGRIRKEGKRRPPLTRYSHSSDSNSRELLVSNTSTSRTHSPRPRPARSSNALHSARSDCSRSHLLLDAPPPSFEEAIAQGHGRRTLQSTRSAPPSIRPPLTSTRSQPFPSSESINPASLPLTPPIGSGSESSITTNAQHVGREGHVEWENDRSAGLTLEERVRRDFERRQLAEALPRAANIRSTSYETRSSCSTPSRDTRTPQSEPDGGLDRSGPSQLLRLLNTPVRSSARRRAANVDGDSDWVVVNPPSSSSSTPSSLDLPSVQSNAAFSESQSTYSASVSSSNQHTSNSHCINTALQPPTSSHETNAHKSDTTSNDLLTPANYPTSFETQPSSSRDSVPISITPSSRSGSPVNMETEQTPQAFIHHPLPPHPSFTPLTRGPPSPVDAEQTSTPISENNINASQSLAVVYERQDSEISQDDSQSPPQGAEVMAAAEHPSSSILDYSNGPTVSEQRAIVQGSDYMERRSSEGLTELDLLLARLDDPDVTIDGRSYDDLLLLEEIIGPANHEPRGASLFDEVPMGSVEVLRRRVTKEGKTKLKLALLGTVVDRCGICLSQFKEGATAGLLPCMHAFHGVCLRNWLRSSSTCPICRRDLVASIPGS